MLQRCTAGWSLTWASCNGCPAAHASGHAATHALQDACVQHSNKLDQWTMDMWAVKSQQTAWLHIRHDLSQHQAHGRAATQLQTPSPPVPGTPLTYSAAPAARCRLPRSRSCTAPAWASRHIRLLSPDIPAACSAAWTRRTCSHTRDCVSVEVRLQSHNPELTAVSCYSSQWHAAALT